MVYNKKLASKLYTRKLFKTYVFHNDNTEEEYYWDDHDTTNYYIIKPKQSAKPSAKPSPRPKPTTCLPRPPVEKILFSNSSTQNNSTSTQTNSSNQNNTTSTQTSPKFYFPRHRFNLKVEPFNTNLSLQAKEKLIL